MKALGVLLILLIAEAFCMLWDMGFKAIEWSNLYTQMVTWATVDFATILILDKYPVRHLTRPIQAILALSVITHGFAAYAWVAYNQPYLDVYDNVLKESVFILEVMVFIAYGIFRGGKRLRVLFPWARLHHLFSGQGSSTAHLPD